MKKDFISGLPLANLPMLYASIEYVVLQPRPLVVCTHVFWNLKAHGEEKVENFS